MRICSTAVGKMPLWRVLPGETWVLFVTVFTVLTWSLEHACTHAPTHCLEFEDRLSRDPQLWLVIVTHVPTEDEKEFPGRKRGAVQRERTIVRRETLEEPEFYKVYQEELDQK